MYLDYVAQFHRATNAPVLSTPQIPSADRVRLRLSLLDEELDELKEAIAQKNLVKVLDAFEDLQYVLSGAVHEFGMGPCFDAGFLEVHFSNMSKTHTTAEEAEVTRQHYLGQGIGCFVEAVGDRWIVYRQADQKILKNKNYSPASLGGFIASL